MATKKIFLKASKVSIIIQLHNIRRKYKELIVEDYSNKVVDITLKAEVSKQYMLKIRYKGYGIPEALININELENIDNIPHNYGTTQIGEERYLSLCLFYGREWNSNKNISDTIIPWAIEWIYYYELWLITGNWLGGGIHKAKEEKSI